jgi:hypothetical protein
MASQELIQAIAATVELCGARLSEAAVDMLIADLSGYPEKIVIDALVRVRRGGKRFSVGAIIEEIDANDERPGPDKAWALIPKSEDQTVVWTREMAVAHGVAAPLLEMGDKFGAHRAFREEYVRLCEKARERAERVQWEVSLGLNPHGREPVISEAINRGLLPPSSSMLLPPKDADSIPTTALLTSQSDINHESMTPENEIESFSSLKQLLSRSSRTDS